MKLYSRKKRNPLKVIILILILVAGIFVLSKIITGSKVDDIVVAQIGTENIYKSEIEKKINDVFANNPSAKIPFEKLPDQVLEIIAREVFLDRKIIAEAKRLGIDNSKEVKDQIESYKTTIIRQSYENSQLKLAIDDQKIVEKFNEINLNNNSKNEYKYSQIVLRDEFTAKNVIKDLKSGKKPIKFFDGARKYSIDTQSSSTGGEVDFKSESTIKEPILNVLKSLSKDEISSPFLVDDLWYIVKLNEVKKPKPIDFESSKEYVKHLLKIEEIQKINGKFLKDDKVKILIKRSNPQDNEKANTLAPNSQENNTNINETDKNSNPADSTAPAPAVESAPNSEGTPNNNEAPQQKL
jgi:parvulin-like peptidyl-prolyl isomerase